MRAKIEDLGQGIYTASIKNKTGVAVSMTPDTKTIDPLSQFCKPIEVGEVGKTFAAWGKDNKLPYTLMNLIYYNNLAPGSIDTKDQIALGDKLIFYYEDFQNGKFIPTPFYDSELQDWLDGMQEQKYREEAIIDFHWFSNFFAQLRTGKGSLSQKVVAIDCIEALDCRSEIINPKSGRVEGIGVADWKTGRPANGKIEVVPTYNPAWKKLPGKFMLHLKKKSPGNPFYPLPSWIGAQEWLRHANKIPVWKSANMDNSINIKYHISIPESYFLQLYPEPDHTQDFRRKKYEEKVAEIINFLSGAKNVSKAFFTQYAVDKMTGKELPGWKIEVIDNKINHEAYSQDYEDANSAILSALGVDPSLSGVLITGKMGAGSGSEKRESYMFHAKVKTRYARNLLLEPLELAMKLNGYDKRNITGVGVRKIHLGIQDVELTTLDKNPTGSQKTL
jgi:hypothetical protein